MHELSLAKFYFWFEIRLLNKIYKIQNLYTDLTYFQNMCRKMRTKNVFEFIY